MSLLQALESWREQQLVESGMGENDFFGPQLMLADSIMTQIINLAHHGKIQDITSLKEQTEW
ncbi:hypothetical protein EDB19DRAFT_1647321 [Suillus lakei]|nr:hypothetical protein EDB19DRAFT_1647321 [Suillus lakei]